LGENSPNPVTLAQGAILFISISQNLQIQIPKYIKNLSDNVGHDYQI
jgi:hypothetical protein